MLLLRRRRPFAVLDDLVVDLRLGRALGDEGLGLVDLLVDDRLELLERLRADQATAVDEEVRRAAGLDVLGQLHALIELLLVLVLVDGGLDLVHVEAELFADGFQILVFELRCESNSSSCASQKPLSPFWA